ncbi:hypothetical protein KJ966_10270 [bacterium]|nr:hypothetical protein [bacterium]
MSYKKIIGTLIFFISCFNSPILGFNDEEVIDIRGFNYGRLQIAFNVEKSPGSEDQQLEKTVELLKRNLMWSGLFDIKDIFDKYDLVLKIRYVPRNEIRVWIYSPDNTLLFDHRRPVSDENELQPAAIKMVEEIIFQLTGERSILRSAIAYVEKDQSDRYRILLTDAFGEKRFILIDDNNFNILPRWKPNASALLFTTLGQQGSHLRQYDFKSGTITTLFKNLNKLSGGSWSHTGEHLVITKSIDGNSDLFKINLKGEIVEQLTFRSSTEANPRLSPDGKRLLFVSNRSGSIQIYQRILDTRETFRMTFEGNLNVEPNWSNDGAYIVFSGLKDNVYQIFLMDKEGDFVQQITYGNHSAEQPVWAPNGRQVLFVSKINYDQKLFVIRADGTYKRRLTQSGPGINEFNPTWSEHYKWPAGN